MGAGEQITLDFSGNGLMKITVPTKELSNITDINGIKLESLVTNNGSLIAEGGYIQLSAKTAEKVNAWSSKCWFIRHYINSKCRSTNR